MPGDGLRNLTVSDATWDMLEAMRMKTGYETKSKMLDAVKVVGQTLVVPSFAGEVRRSKPTGMRLSPDEKAVIERYRSDRKANGGAGSI